VVPTLASNDAPVSWYQTGFTFIEFLPSVRLVPFFINLMVNLMNM